MALAIFDLDETLIAKDCDHEWGEYMVSRGLVDTASFRKQNDFFYHQYKAGGLDIHAYLAFVCGNLADHEPERLHDLREDFIRDVVNPVILPKARDLVRQHVDAGDHPVIITATVDFVSTRVARCFDIDDVIAPIAEKDGTRFTGRSTGTPSFHAGKVTRMQEWITARGADPQAELRAGCFYSDSINDLPLLERVGRPVAVDPDDALRREAQARKWQIISLRT